LLGGVTWRVPLTGREPKPGVRLAETAFELVHESVTEAPFVTLVWEAPIVHVGGAIGADDATAKYENELVGNESLPALSATIVFPPFSSIQLMPSSLLSTRYSVPACNPGIPKVTGRERFMPTPRVSAPTFAILAMLSVESGTPPVMVFASLETNLAGSTNSPSTNPPFHFALPDELTRSVINVFSVPVEEISIPSGDRSVMV
jgi:hypothetical protein